MGQKYTKDALIDAIIDNQKSTVLFMERLNDTLEKLNDNNLLHKQALEENTKSTKQALDVNTTATKEMTTAIKIQSTYLKVQGTYIKWITIVLVAAIVILAGAEKALKFLPILK